MLAMRCLLSSIVLASYLSGLAGCGGNGAPASTGNVCQTVPACGGDLRGTWTIATTCLSTFSANSKSCPQETISGSGYSATGSYVFNDDMTYSTNLTVAGAFTIVLPGTCVTGDLAADCTMLDTFYKSWIQRSAPQFAGAACVVSGTGCDCTFTASGQPAQTSGTYEYSNPTTVALTPSSLGIAQPNAYCVDGTSLYLGFADDSSSTVGALVLTKTK